LQGGPASDPGRPDRGRQCGRHQDTGGQGRQGREDAVQVFGRGFLPEQPDCAGVRRDGGMFAPGFGAEVAGGRVESAMKVIGLIGGMSCESTAHYYARLNERVRDMLGGLHSAEILMWSVDFAPVAQMQAEGRWQEAGAQLAAIAKRLEGAGAD